MIWSFSTFIPFLVLCDEPFSFQVKLEMRENWLRLNIAQIDYNIENHATKNKKMK